MATSKHHHSTQNKPSNWLICEKKKFKMIAYWYLGSINHGYTHIRTYPWTTPHAFCIRYNKCNIGFIKISTHEQFVSLTSFPAWWKPLCRLLLYKQAGVCQRKTKSICGCFHLLAKHTRVQQKVNNKTSLKLNDSLQKPANDWSGVKVVWVVLVI